MKWLFAAVGLLLAVVVLGSAWLLGTQSGLHWSAGRVEAASQGKLSLRGLRGALASRIAFDEIRFRDDRADIRLSTGEMRLELLSFLGGRAGIRSLRAESLDIELARKGDSPPKAPGLPVDLRVGSADIARIRFGQSLVENFQLRDTVLQERGAISAHASFAIRHAGHSARGRLRLGGTLQRIEAAFSGSVAGIPANGTARLNPFAEQPLEALDAEAGPADLSSLDPQWPHTAITARLQGESSAAGALAGTLTAGNAQPGPLDQQRLPIIAAETGFATDLKSVSLRDLKIRLSRGGALSGSGEVGAGGADLDLRATGLNLRAFGSKLRETDLRGPLRVIASGKTQSVRGTLAQDGISLSADLLRAGDVLQVRSLRALADGGEATGSGRLRLAEEMRFEAKLKLARFDPARFGDYPPGSINGSVDAAGALRGDSHVDARWVIDDSTLRGEALASRGAARIARQRVSRADAAATLGSTRLAVRGAFGKPGDELLLELEGAQLGQITGDVSGRLRASAKLAGKWDDPVASLHAEASDVSLPNGMVLASVAATATGALAKHDAEILVRAADLDLAARLRGGWHQAAGWSGELYSLRNSGRFPLRLAAPAALRVSSRRIELGRLEARLGDGVLLVKQLAWSESRLVSSGEFRGLPAQWLILAGGLTERLRASLLVDGDWNLAAAPRLTGSLALRRAAGDLTVLDGAEIALGIESAGLKAQFEQSRMSATAELASKYGTISVQGKVQPEPDAPGLALTGDSAATVDARVRFADLRALTQSLSSDARLDGRLAATLQGTGTLRELRLDGSLEGEAIALQMPRHGVYLKDGELRATLEGDRLRITRFSIRGGQGQLTAGGTLPLRVIEGGGGAKLEWRARNFGLLERPDRRLSVSGAGEAQLLDKRVALSGALRAERGYLEFEQDRLPELGDDVVIAGQPAARPKERARVPVALDVQLDLGEQLEVRGYGLEGRLGGKLHIETTKEGELRAYGRIHTVNATFLAYGQRLEVDPGVAVFDGPLDNPSLQMTAWRRNQQVEAGVQVSGTARAPRVQTVSQPPVPEGERLSWLVLGRAPADATKADLGLLQAAAGALLARGDQMPLDRRLAQAFGLDEISLRGSGEVADRTVAVGKRLSERLYVSYEHGLGAVASALVKLDFSLTQRLSVRTETGTSSGVGLFYRFSWD